MQIEINRQLLGLEDLLFGEGTATQTRAGQSVTVTKINAANLPFDETTTLLEVLETNYPMVEIVGADLALGADSNVIRTGENIAHVVRVSEELDSTEVLETISADLELGVESEIRKANANKANIDKVVSMETYITDAIPAAYEAEAQKLTADSYATEPEDVFVKIYTSNGDGTFSYTNSTEYSALHWATKALELVTDGVIDDTTPSAIKTYSSEKIEEIKSALEGATSDVATDLGNLISDTVPSLTNAYSSSKTQALHNSQQSDISGLVQSILALQTSTAQGQFGGTSTVVVNSTEKVLPFNVITQSTNTSIFEITNGTGIIKEAGTYSFISVVDFEDVGADGDVATVTFNLRDTTTNDIYYSQVRTIELSNFDRETIPFNSLMVVPDTMTFPITIDINVVSDIAGYNIVGFNSIISRDGGDIATIDTIDVSLGNLITEVLV
jgi:hypothetical protein